MPLRRRPTSTTSAGPTREASFVESYPNVLVLIFYSSPPPSPDDREPVALGLPRKSKRLSRARQALCTAEMGNPAESSERRQIPGSVKSSCPFAPVPRRRRGGMRNTYSLPTGRFRVEASAAGSQTRPTFLNLALLDEPTKVLKRGSRADSILPLPCESKASGALRAPRKIPPRSLRRGTKRATPGPGSPPALVITMVRQEGCA
jgi:hypothetical protein